MGKCWLARIEKIEQSAKSVYGEKFFKEWLKKHPLDPTQSIWTLLDIVPQEMRMYCMFHIFDELKKDQTPGSLST